MLKVQPAAVVAVNSYVEIRSTKVNDLFDFVDKMLRFGYNHVVLEEIKWRA
jgi:hypothetical protein